MGLRLQPLRRRSGARRGPPRSRAASRRPTRCSSPRSGVVPPKPAIEARAVRRCVVEEADGEHRPRVSHRRDAQARHGAERLEAATGTRLVELDEDLPLQLSSTLDPRGLLRSRRGHRGGGSRQGCGEDDEIPHLEKGIGRCGRVEVTLERGVRYLPLLPLFEPVPVYASGQSRRSGRPLRLGGFFGSLLTRSTPAGRPSRARSSVFPTWDRLLPSGRSPVPAPSRRSTSSRARGRALRRRPRCSRTASCSRIWPGAGPPLARA